MTSDKCITDKDCYSRMLKGTDQMFLVYNVLCCREYIYLPKTICMLPKSWTYHRKNRCIKLLFFTKVTGLFCAGSLFSVVGLFKYGLIEQLPESMSS